MESLGGKSWPNLAMDLIMKTEFPVANDEASSSSGQPLEADKCWVCGCSANGRHYGVMACFGCKGFFRRSVQGSKNYICRHERNCVIDQNDRNCCRACRFEKCLYVGMDPAAIQPDRDKTGRQRNPRKSHYQNRQSSYPNSNENSNDGREQSMPQSANGSERGSSPSGVDQVIIDTLVEIEDICRQFKPEISTPYQNILAAVERPSTVFSRTTMTFDGSGGPVPVRALHDDILRLCVLMLDYVNTLRPLADVASSDKVAVIRQCMCPFILLVVGFHSAERPDDDNIYLPSGHVIASQQSFFQSNTEDDMKIMTMLEIKSRSIRQNLIDQLITPLRRMRITVIELAAVKAIMTLDPYAPGMSKESVELLTSGREAVQRALFAHIRTRLPNEEATARFAHLLMLITTVTRIAAQVTIFLHQLKETSIFSDVVITELMLQSL